VYKRVAHYIYLRNGSHLNEIVNIDITTYLNGQNFNKIKIDLVSSYMTANF